MNMKTLKTQVLVEGGLVVALTVILSHVKLWHMPQGGSITLENLPLLFFALRHGLKLGMGAGFVAGLVQILLGGYVAHPIQALLDYPLAFAALGTAALTRKPLWLGMTMGTCARFLCHVLSGIVFFGSYAPEGTPAWFYSMTYNGTFMLPSLLLAIGMGYLIWPHISTLGQVER